MKPRNNTREEKRERQLTGKALRLTELLRTHGFHTAAQMIDIRQIENIDAAIASWKNYPKCMDEYPTHITKKVKFDPKELVALVDGATL